MADDHSPWYKDAIIYQLHVKAFFDSNDDGVGDFRGLTRKLDYLADLGVNTIWLLPFYPSPLRDDGYDISDYRSVHPAYGTLRDFRAFVRAAHGRGLRVITELVINHTSDQHRWFKRARRSKPGSAWRNYYVWSDTDEKYRGTRIIFCDTEASNWSWDPEAQAYYWHRFFHHQPDLNFDNPRVFDEVVRVMKHWLSMGVDGLRLDAIPYLCEREGTSNENLPETHAVIRRLRQWLDENFEDRLFLGEANQWPEDVLPYFGDADECHMAFHFPLMPRMYMAMAQEDRHPITDILRQTPDIPSGCQWAIFLRNHDELTLEMVSDRERDYLWKFYASDPRARINVGIRRRLAPLLENDRRKIELLNSLLMSMPGSPIVYYGDEIGMGDNIFLGDRDGVRTPMQWSPDRNGGFSRADPARLLLPPIMDPVYGYEAVNVEAQMRSPSSLLRWMQRLIDVRKTHRAFGNGGLRFLYPGNRKILAYLREFDGETILCVANLSRAAQPVELDLSELKGRVPLELLGRTAFPPIGDQPYLLTLAGYGFFWFVLAEEQDAPAWHEPYLLPPPDLETVVLSRGWTGMLAKGARETLEQRILPQYLPAQRWYGGKEDLIRAVRVVDSAVLADDDLGSLIAIVDVDLAQGAPQRYQLSLAVSWETAGEEPYLRLQAQALARARRVNRLGVLYEAMADEPFTAAAVAAIRAGRSVATTGGARIEFSATRALDREPISESEPVRSLGSEQSNTSTRVGDEMIFKLYRRLQAGIHPEVEIGRFLTEVAGFQNIPALLGTVERIDSDGTPTALAVLQRYVANQGDGWTVTREHVLRLLENTERVPEELAVELVDGSQTVYLHLASRLGQRLGELHGALASGTDAAAFRSEPVGAGDLRAWRRQASRQAAAAAKALRGVRGTADAETGERAAELLSRWDEVGRLISNALPAELEIVKIRIHGDLHLGQTVVVEDDVYFLDFEGEPGRPMAERRLKSCPLRDVAGIVRSFNYAAWAALSERAAIRPEALEVERPRAEQWERGAVEDFLAGYRQAIADCPAVPADPAIFRRLLDFFLLERALYEICYEAANRPEWLRIPLHGVGRLLAGQPLSGQE